MSNNYTPNHSHTHGHGTYNPNYPPNQVPYYYGPQYPPRGRGGPPPGAYSTFIPSSSFHPPPGYPPAFQPQPINYFNPYNPSAPAPAPVIQNAQKPKKTIQITKSDGTVPEFIAKKVENTPSAPTSAAASPLSSNTNSPLVSPAISVEKKTISLTKKDGAEVKFERDLKEAPKEVAPHLPPSDNAEQVKNEVNESKKEDAKKEAEEIKETKEEKTENKESKEEVKEDKAEAKDEHTSDLDKPQPEKSELQTASEEAASKLTEENDNDDIEDSWENRQEEDLTDLQDKDDIENFDPNRTWRPDFEDGDRVYTLDFLTKFQGFCKDKPEGMASFDIFVDYNRGGGSDWRGSRYGNAQGSGGGGGRGPRGRDGGGQSRNSPKSPHRSNYRDRDNNYMKKSRDNRDTRENPALRKASNLSKVEMVLKTAKGLLNKLTFEKFDSLCEKIVNVGIDEETLEPIIKLVFEKAVTEPKYSMMYTKLCKILSVKYPTYQRNGETISFRRILLNKCQEEFENKKKVDPNNSSLSKEELDEMDFKIRLRMKGNITFIGELFKEKMLNDQIIHYCINHLLGDVNNPDPANIEGLCRFFTTIGKMLDSEKNKEKINSYFDKLRYIKDKSNLSVRIKFAIDDVFDLRKNRWVPRRADEAPDTIKGVHKSIESKQSNTPPASPHRNKDKRNVGSSSLGKSSSDHRIDHSNSHHYKPKDNRDGPVGRKDSLSNSISNKKLQPESSFPKSQSPNPPSSSSSSSHNNLSPEKTTNLLHTNIDEFMNGQPIEDEEYRDININVIDVVEGVFLYLIKKNLDASKTSKLFSELLTRNFITPPYFVNGVNKVIKDYEEYAEDFPKLSLRIATILVELANIISPSQLAQLDDSNSIIPFLLNRKEVRDQIANSQSNYFAQLEQAKAGK